LQRAKLIKLEASVWPSLLLLGHHCRYRKHVVSQPRCIRLLDRSYWPTCTDRPATLSDIGPADVRTAATSIQNDSGLPQGPRSVLGPVL